MTRRVEIYREPIEGVEYEWALEYRYSPGRPARIWGPAESCYPAEPPEVDPERWLRDGQPVEPDEIPADVRQELVDKAYEYEADCEEEEWNA